MVTFKLEEGCTEDKFCYSVKARDPDVESLLVHCEETSPYITTFRGRVLLRFLARGFRERMIDFINGEEVIKEFEERGISSVLLTDPVVEGDVFKFEVRLENE